MGIQEIIAASQSCAITVAFLYITSRLWPAYQAWLVNRAALMEMQNAEKDKERAERELDRNFREALAEKEIKSRHEIRTAHQIALTEIINSFRADLREERDARVKWIEAITLMSSRVEHACKYAEQHTRVVSTK